MTLNGENSGSPRILQYFLDTRPLWPVRPQSNKKDEVQQLKIVASQELGLLTPDEQASVLRFYHLKDAKLSLASHLLKHFIITKHCSIPWSESKVSRDTHRKPCYIPPNTSAKRIDFNVSHQAGIVSLIAAVGFKERVDVGTDVTCWNERKKHDDDHVEKDGLFDWIDMHADVFAESEVTWMKLGELDLQLAGKMRGYGKDAISRCERRGGSIDVEVEGRGRTEVVKVSKDDVIDAKLRRFYAMWCLRESYVKMTGDALLAPWLRDLEILDMQAPAAHPEANESISLLQGECLKSENINFKGRRVRDVYMDLSAIGQDYMIARCVRFSERTELANPQDTLSREWKELQLQDILPLT